MKLPRILISGPHRSSGKTSVTMGLGRALRDRGLTVQGFKKGPDYIDPMWITAATDRECHNLDFFFMGEEGIRDLFAEKSRGADVALVEGNMGLFDGLDLHGKDSSSNLARVLGLPILLVVEANRMTRGIAPLLLGYQKFEPDIRISGIILNKVNGARHESKLRAAIDHYCGLEIVGVIPKNSEFTVTERHLGLIPLKEDPKLISAVQAFGNSIRENVNVDRILEISRQAQPLPDRVDRSSPVSAPRVRLGVAMDNAFTFYYKENLDALKRAGAELIPFDTLKDSHLPDVQGLYIGGGFPEVFMEDLERNANLRAEIRAAVENGLPVYAECGGMMYLARTLKWGEKVGEMVGVLPCEVEMTKRPMGSGYVILEGTGKSSWLDYGHEVRGHEFHFSKLTHLGNVEFAYNMGRGNGIDGTHDGIIYKNVLALYSHLHVSGAPEWAEKFVGFVQSVNFQKNRAPSPTLDPA